MAFRLKPHESVKRGISRIIRREIDHTLETLSYMNCDENEIVHDIRTHCKKIRAVLRLVRNEIGDETYHYENRCFRDVANPLREIRDAKVHIDTLENLVKNDFLILRKKLTDDYQAVRSRVLAKEQVFDTVAKTLDEARPRTESWTSACKGRKSLELGLKHAYRKAYEAFGVASAYPTTSNLHEWRKRTKYLWYQLEVLHPIRPKIIKPLCRECHTCARLLGDDHDLAMLSQRIAAEQDIRDNDNIKSLLLIIEQRRRKLQKKAKKLGETLYKERPDIFVERIKN